MRKMFKEFKTFALRGNVLEMAVGIIIGGAFGRVVTSFVNDILMPFISLLTGGVTLSDLVFVIPGLQRHNIEPIEITYGQFLQNIFDFFIIALTIFIAIKVAKKIRERYTKCPVEEPKKPCSTEELLLEIRDMLKKEDV